MEKFEPAKKWSFEESGTLLADRPVLFLTVSSGPDQGKTGRFDQASISLGRAWGNEFKLKDLSVSGHHGVFARTDEGFIYQDVGSTHGSNLQIGEKSFSLNGRAPNEPIEVSLGGELEVGISTITFEIHYLYASSTEGGASQLKFMQEEVACLTTMQLPGENLEFPYAYADPRMEILLRLGRRLNGLTQLNEILALIADAAFEGLPNASLLAINQTQDGELLPLLVKVCDAPERDAPEVVLNPAVLKRVLESGKAILFTPEDEGSIEREPGLNPEVSICMCAPLMGQKSILGVVLARIRDSGKPFDRKDLGWFSVLASSAAFALERASLNQDIYRMFEGFVQASVGAIEARDPTTAGHSQRVAKYSLALAKSVIQSNGKPFDYTTFTPAELTELRYAALLHDFGKVCVREEVLMKSARLSDTEMARIHQRFQFLRSEYQRKLAETQLNDAVRAAEQPTQLMLEKLQARTTQFSRELTQAFQQLQDLRTKWRLDPDEIARLQVFGHRRIETLDGRELSFLTEREIENITIPIGTLNAREWQEMRAHVIESESFLSRIPWSEDLKEIPAIAGAHHEKLDGSGYPKGLRGDAISLKARILTIADIYDACTAWDRPYCQPIGLDDTIVLLRKEAGENKLDEDLVDLFVVNVLPEVKHLAPRR